MAGTIGERVVSFRSSFTGLKHFVLLMSFVIGTSSAGGVITRSDDILEGILLAAVVFLPAAGMAYALMAGLLWLAIRAYPVHVHRGGLRSYNSVGAYTSMSWSEMSTVKNVDYLGMEYYEITSSWSGKKILVPHFLADRAGFNARVASLVRSNHVLLRTLDGKQKPGTVPEASFK